MADEKPICTTNQSPKHNTEIKKKKLTSGVSLATAFKEERNQTSQLPDPDHQKSLDNLKQLLSNVDSPSPLSIFGVPLLISDERTDTILLKFLRARDFNTKETLTMIKNTIRWRRDFEIEKLVNEDLGLDEEMEKIVFMRGVDREGHPVCYNDYGEICEKVFGDKQGFLRWRVQYLEKGIREFLEFKPGGISTIVQVTDLKNSAGVVHWEFRQAFSLLLDNYPEFVEKQVFINVPWWYLAFNRMISPFLTQRTKSKFVFAAPSKSAETLFRYISPEQVPVQFGGLHSIKDSEFTIADTVTEININPSSSHTIEIHVTGPCFLVWELRVLEWDISYGAEFLPNSSERYTVILHKPRKMAVSDDPVVRNSFKVCGPGKTLLTVENTSSKRKLLLYRFKVKKSESS